MFYRNRFLQIFMAFAAAYYGAMLILVGVMLPMILPNVYHGACSMHVLDGWMPFLLIMDFYLRFTVQETPSHDIKPYLLLPISRKSLMHLYLRRAALSWSNTYWGLMLIPFGIIIIPHLLGWSNLLFWLLAWWLLMVMNSYAYILCRALCYRHLAWIILPLVCHAVLIGLQQLFLDTASTLLLYHIAELHIWAFLPIIIAIAVLYYANFRLQSAMLYEETAKEEKASRNFRWLQVPEGFFSLHSSLFTKTEFLLRFRNSNIRKQQLTGLALMLVFSLMIGFTDIYDNAFMESFCCMYVYATLGLITMITIFCHEGNYMDLLMSRKECILQLLKAKYRFNSFMLVLPFLMLLPAVINGKISIWMSIGYMLFTSGCIYPAIMQMAVYNKNTIPLNTKLTGKNSSTAQNVLSIVMLFIPLSIEKLLVLLLGEPWGYITLGTLGVTGIAASPWWLRDIYHRFMQRRYENLDGFRQIEA